MDQEEIYTILKSRNVRVTSQDLEVQCMRYRGQYAHRAHGTFRQHFLLYQLDEDEVLFDNDLSYEELRKRFPEDFRCTMKAISECLAKEIIMI